MSGYEEDAFNKVLGLEGAPEARLAVRGSLQVIHLQGICLLLKKRKTINKNT